MTGRFVRTMVHSDSIESFKELLRQSGRYRFVSMNHLAQLDLIEVLVQPDEFPEALEGSEYPLASVMVTRMPESTLLIVEYDVVNLPQAPSPSDKRNYLYEY